MFKLIMYSFFIVCLNTHFSDAALGQIPENAIFLEAENIKIKNSSFKIFENIHVSKGAFISYTGIPDSDSEIFQLDLPDDGKDHTVWICSKGLDLGFFSSKTGMKKFTTESDSWKWHNLGTYNRKNTGGSFSIYMIAKEKRKLEDAGIDCIILSEYPEFKPEGVYFGYSESPTANSAESTAAEAKTIQNVNIKIYPEKSKSKISRFIASANADGAQMHISRNREWNETMKTFFSGNILILLQRAKAKPDENGCWWDFQAIDEFIVTAKKTWNAETIMLLPAWNLKNITGKTEDYTEEDFEKGREVFVQLAGRYARPGILHVEYWAIADEWTAGGYWQKNRKKFCEYYTYLLRELKKINPAAKVGGPVDCWPDQDEIAELMRQCPELDFIAWNMFTAGRADYPLPRLFEASENLSKNILLCREAGRNILGREIPVMVSSYGSNYHAWAPPDYKLAAPIAGVWNALALSRMAESGSFCAASYNIRASDCGLFGPDDTFARKLRISAANDSINVRSSAFIQLFFKENIASTYLCDIAQAIPIEKFSIIATRNNAGKIAIVMVNYSENDRKISLEILPFNGASAKGFNLPVKYIYCDSWNLATGNGLFFNADGKGILFMPPYSAYCLEIQ